MRIRFTTAPAYVCERRVPHHDVCLAAFVGLELEAELNEDGTLYQVELQEVLRALSTLGQSSLVAHTYWTSHWHRICLMLHEHVYFPVNACEVIASTSTTTAPS